MTIYFAAGGLLGTASYGWLSARVSLGNLMRAGLIIETLTHVSLALTTTTWVALVIMVVLLLAAPYILDRYWLGIANTVLIAVIGVLAIGGAFLFIGRAGDTNVGAPAQSASVVSATQRMSELANPT